MKNHFVCPLFAFALGSNEGAFNRSSLFHFLPFYLGLLTQRASEQGPFFFFFFLVPIYLQQQQQQHWPHCCCCCCSPPRSNSSGFSPITGDYNKRRLLGWRVGLPPGYEWTERNFPGVEDCPPIYCPRSSMAGATFWDFATTLDEFRNSILCFPSLKTFKSTSQKYVLT